MDDINPTNTPTTSPSTPTSPQLSISKAVIRALAEADDCDPADLTPPLYETIDPDALNALYARASPHVHFDYGEYHVEITPSQRVNCIAEDND